MAVPYAVARAGIGSNDLEMLSGIVLLGLFRREPGAEEGEGLSLGWQGGGPARSAVATAIIMQVKVDSATQTSRDSCAQIIRLAAVV
jgi:hypothetical protein